MRHSIRLFIILLFVFISFSACLQDAKEAVESEGGLQTGAQQTTLYVPLLQGKKVGLLANHSSLIGDTHLADTLIAMGVELKRVFAPEHGFRGVADAGEHVKDGIDKKSGLAVVSLYGKDRKPADKYLQDLDIILFDIQDVGVRFYTYISTLTYVMEAAAENGIPIILLDRPNPNGFYIDGPVMEEAYTSFVGLHPVPIVYGMTIGEYGSMVNGEGWLANHVVCDLTVIPLKNYKRDKLYKLPVRPSPNLPNWQSVYLYPSLCLFEGTIVSVGRGTEMPFTIYGHPDFHVGSFVFTPASSPGAKYPKLEDEHCYGQNLMGYAKHYQELEEHFSLQWILGSYEQIAADSSFFIPYFEKLAGNGELRKQIASGKNQDEIKATWQDDIHSFKAIRRRYLLYDDFK